VLRRAKKQLRVLGKLFESSTDWVEIGEQVSAMVSVELPRLLARRSALNAAINRSSDLVRDSAKKSSDPFEQALVARTMENKSGLEKELGRVEQDIGAILSGLEHLESDILVSKHVSGSTGNISEQVEALSARVHEHVEEVQLAEAELDEELRLH
jgi:hypothetical protein